MFIFPLNLRWSPGGADLSGISATGGGDPHPGPQDLDPGRARAAEVLLRLRLEASAKISDDGWRLFLGLIQVDERISIYRII